MLLLVAIAEHRLDRRDAARDALRQALALSFSGGYGRTVTDKGEEVEALIRWLVGWISGALGGWVEQLLKTMSQSQTRPPHRGQSARPELVEPLTERELQIVSQLRGGPSNRQLSDALLITPGTLKWHLSNIYGKLGVPNRLAAIARAQELVLLDPGE